MSRTVRIVVITLGLSVAGAAFGGIASVIATVIWLTVGSMLLMQELPSADLLGFLFVGAPFAGAVGAVIGSVLGPLAAWLLLQRVPLGIAVTSTTLGAIAGGALAALSGIMHPGLLTIMHPALGAIVGFSAVALALQKRYSPSPAGPLVEDGTSSRAHQLASEE
jgi:hypothetical protein